MKRALFIIALLISSTLIGQSLFVPTATGVVKQVPLKSGINVMIDMTGTMQTPTPVAFGGAYINVILALPHQTDGDQALADCMAGKVPAQSVVGTTPNCAVNQQNAINNAMGARVKLALQSIPTSVLQANDIELIQ